jgi:hypothetical protein
MKGLSIMEKKVAVIGNNSVGSILAKIATAPTKVAATFKENLKQVRAEQRGEGISKARLILQARDVPGIGAQMDNPVANRIRVGGPRPIANGYVLSLDKEAYQFHTDGSLRRVVGPKPNLSGRQLRKARKLVRRLQKEGKLTSRKPGAQITVVADGE